MKRYHIFRRAFCVFLLAAFAVGCGAGEDAESRESTESISDPYADVTGMEETPVVDYILPRQYPNVLVDRKGYSPEDGKRAVVRGRELPESFRLVDEATGETVFSGAVENAVYDADQGLYLGYADFSDFALEGTYYLQCDLIGQSYRFEIKKRMYEELFRETCELFLESCDERTLTLAGAVALLQAYEWYSAVFPDEDKDNVPDVLKSLRGWISYREEKGGEEAALYAAFLAKFSYLYQKFDHEYATDCLKRASTVFGREQDAPDRDADSFFALTELYRATGLYTYRKQIVGYKGFFEDNGGYPDETAYLYAAMTYMATRKKVDVELCQILMGDLMERAEETSGCYQDMIHPISAENEGPADLLKRATELSCANYVMNNYQYTRITEELLHYLMGLNPESVNFYEEAGDRTGYLLLLAQLSAGRQESDREG